MTSDTNPEISSLRNQVFTLLVALIVVSGTLTVYLYRQASVSRKDLDAMEPQAKQVIDAFNQNQKLMLDFINQLITYSQAHPEFKPVLAKYGIVPAAAAPAAAAPVAPKIAAPAAPKK